MDLTPQPGWYALCLRLEHPERLHPGRLGELEFAAGDYVYVGSARGPGGVRARLGRHLRQEKKPHWHVDALTLVARVTACLVALDDRSNPGDGMPLECAWSQRILQLPLAGIPAPGFGSQDCRYGCQAHLVYFKKLDLQELTNILCDVTPQTLFLQRTTGQCTHKINAVDSSYFNQVYNWSDDG